MPDYLYKQIADIIANDIKNKDIPVGTKLPSERVLADQYHVSRNVIRKACTLLAQRTIVKIEPQDGVYVTYSCDEKVVAALRSHLIHEKPLFLDSLEVREVLETAIVEKSLPYLTEEKITRLEEIYQKMDSLIVEGKIQQFMQQDSLFHEFIAQCIPNHMFHLLLKTFFELAPQDIFLLSRATEVALNKTQGEHRVILDALIEKDPILAVAAIHTHMKNIKADFMYLEKTSQI